MYASTLVYQNFCIPLYKEVEVRIKWAGEHTIVSGGLVCSFELDERLLFYPLPPFFPHEIYEQYKTKDYLYTQ